MDDMKMVTDFSLKIDKLESAFLVHIPAYNIHFYTTKEDEMEQSAHESLVSFFRYRIKEQGMDKFLSHMLSLGFTIKSVSGKPSSVSSKGSLKDAFLL